MVGYPKTTSQDENDNHDDVRGEPLTNAIKNMDIGDIRPRQVDDEQDSDYLVHAPSNEQINDNQASLSSPTQDQQEASSSSQSNDQPSTSNQLLTLQPTSIAKDHIIGDITSGVQTRSRLASFYEYYSFVSSIEPTKIEEALQDIDWVNAMHEELNNFTRNQV